MEWRRALIAMALAVVSVLLLGACGTGGHATGATDPSATVAHRSVPRAGVKLWVNPNSPAAVQAQIWRRGERTGEAALVSRIAAQPTFKWLTGGQQPAQQVAASFVDGAQRAHAVAQFVLYNIPDRDCHGLSGGGAVNATAYLRWVRQVMAGIGDHRVIIILEPDAIDQAASGCLGADGARERYGMLANATKLIEQDPHARIYLDAGDAGWLAPKQIAQPMYLSGISHDGGFSLNVANFYTTAQSIAYGRTRAVQAGRRQAFRDRYQPQRQRRSAWRTGRQRMVQSARPGARPRPDDAHRGGGCRRVPVGQVPRAVRRLVPGRSAPGGNLVAVVRAVAGARRPLTEHRGALTRLRSCPSA
jgi:endoglucanase